MTFCGENSITRELSSYCSTACASIDKFNRQMLAVTERRCYQCTFIGYKYSFYHSRHRSETVKWYCGRVVYLCRLEDSQTQSRVLCTQTNNKCDLSGFMICKTCTASLLASYAVRSKEDQSGSCRLMSSW